MTDLARGAWSELANCFFRLLCLYHSTQTHRFTFSALFRRADLHTKTRACSACATFAFLSLFLASLQCLAFAMRTDTERMRERESEQTNDRHRRMRGRASERASEQTQRMIEAESESARERASKGQNRTRLEVSCDTFVGSLAIRFANSLSKGTVASSDDSSPEESSESARLVMSRDCTGSLMGSRAPTLSSHTGDPEGLCERGRKRKGAGREE